MQRIALLKAMTNREGQAEMLPEDWRHIEPRIERAWLSHQGNVERAAQKQLGQASGHVLDHADLDARMLLAEIVEEPDKAQRPDWFPWLPV